MEKIVIDVTLLGHEQYPSLEQKNAFFTHCFEELYEHIFVIAYDYFNNQLEAEEQAADFFEKLMTWPASRFKEQENLVGYILLATKNHCISVIRALKRRRSRYPTIPIELAFNVQDKTRLTDNRIITEEALAHVMRAVARLPESQRSALMLNAKGYSHQEIAEILNISESASTSRVNRARHKLQALLQAKTPVDDPVNPSP